MLLRFRDGRESISEVRPYEASANATVLLSVALVVWGIMSPHLGDRLTAVTCAPISLWVGLSFRGLRLASGRPFTAPFAPLTPMLGIVTCVWLMMASPVVTWGRFFLWLGLGMVIYLVYGRYHSTLNFPAVYEANTIGFPGQSAPPEEPGITPAP